MMQRRFAWLVIAWTAPALAAGVLGWSGIWGSGGALVDYLIPIPVAGGVLHLPSFIVTTALVWPMRAGSARIAGAGSAPWLLGAAAVGLLMMLDTERLLRAIVSGALFLPSLRPNAFALFLFSDTLLAYLFIHGRVRPARPRQVMFLPGIYLLAMIVWIALLPSVLPGATRDGPADGDEIHTAFTTHSDHERLHDDAYTYAKPFLPQYDVNVEDLAIVFTNNYFKAEMVDTSDPVATLCLYEDGTASRYGAGLLDCFEHRSFTDRLRAHEFDLASHCPGVEQLADKRQSWNMEEQRVCRDWMRKHSEQVPE